jgi:hypothetical protein
MSTTNELAVPQLAKDDPSSSEIIRVWVANKGQHVSIRVGVWEPFAWGIELADLARHLANAFQQDQGMDSNDALSKSSRGSLRN